MIQVAGLKLKDFISLLANRATSLRSDFTIVGFPEYASSIEALASDQRRIFNQALMTIERSQGTFNPVVGVIAVGHSDKALRKPISDRAAFELEVSQKRADAAADRLVRELILRSQGAHYAKTFRYMAVGVGNARPRHAYAINEHQMRQNRRVDIVLINQPLGAPRCGTL